jgi:hypothetical protein
LLKADELGRIEIVERNGVRMIRRDIAAARWWRDHSRARQQLEKRGRCIGSMR